MQRCALRLRLTSSRPRLSPKVPPYVAIAALHPNTPITLYPGAILGISWRDCPPLNLRLGAGDLLLFCSDLFHASAAYTDADISCPPYNLRVFFYFGTRDHPEYRADHVNVEAEEEEGALTDAANLTVVPGKRALATETIAAHMALPAKHAHTTAPETAYHHCLGRPCSAAALPSHRHAPHGGLEAPAPAAVARGPRHQHPSAQHHGPRPALPPGLRRHPAPPRPRPPRRPPPALRPSK